MYVKFTADTEAGLTLGEWKKALEKAEQLGMRDDEVIRASVQISFSPNGALIHTLHIPVEL